MTTEGIQDEIINEFSLLDGDMEMTVFYIMELGQKLPVMDEADKIEENIVKGCQSKVWLTAKLNDGKIFFIGYSKTAITKGLFSLMTLTSPSCPSAEVIPSEVEQKIKAIEGVNDVKVELTFDPPYSQDMMSEAAKLELGFM